MNIAASDFSHFYDSLERAFGFSIIDSDGAQGLVDLEAKVVISKVSP